MGKFARDIPWGQVMIAAALILIVLGGCQCSMRMNIKSVKADDLPPLYLEYFLPSIQNHPFSIGLPPDPIE